MDEKELSRDRKRAVIPERPELSNVRPLTVAARRERQFMPSDALVAGQRVTVILHVVQARLPAYHFAASS